MVPPPPHTHTHWMRVIVALVAYASFVCARIPAVFTAGHKQNNCYPKAVTISVFLEIFYFHFISLQYILRFFIIFNNNKSHYYGHLRLPACT